MAATYRIPDEPRPGGLAEYAVNPFWPFLAMMLGGSWAGLPWFVINGSAIGSATFRREATIAALTPVLSIAYAFVALTLLDLLGLPDRAVAYAVVLLSALKLGAGYYLYVLQHRSFGLFEHFGGRVRQGMVVAIAAAVLRAFVVGAAFEASVWLGVVVV